MLELINIVKNYGEGENAVCALRGVDLKFRRSEFVSILGASGCGKTTLLNIVGGLDRYSDGDLCINGKSTTKFNSRDWDAYRNNCVGFVFQSYNLVPHQTVLGNVEIALAISGVCRSERRQRALAALGKVGLSDQAHKKPNQLSGGQMQRVAIARAIVNDPEIILADEPTGALDSKTSQQVIDLLKEISKDRLVIMVTHNQELADLYSTRIINLLDGRLIGDSNPPRDGEEKAENKDCSVDSSRVRSDADGEDYKAAHSHVVLKKTAMSFFTALRFSFSNLLTKKNRTFITSFAGSIGIIGIALVLAISNGFQHYVNKMQLETLGNYPLSISEYSMEVDELQDAMLQGQSYNAFPDSDEVIVYDRRQNSVSYHYNAINAEYVEYVEALPDLYNYVNAVQYSYAVQPTVIAKDNKGNYTLAETSVRTNSSGAPSALFQEALDNEEFILDQYDVLSGRYPAAADEIAVVVDKYNRVRKSTLVALGMMDSLTGAGTKEQPLTIKFDDLINDEQAQLKLVFNDGFYTQRSNGSYRARTDYAEIFENSEYTMPLKITGVIRVNEVTPSSLYSGGLLHTKALTDLFLSDCMDSEIAKAQRETDGKFLLSVEYDGMKHENPSYDIIAAMFALQGVTMSDSDIKEWCLRSVGASDIPTSIYLYAKSFEAKAHVKEYLDKWNEKQSANKIVYFDAAMLIATALERLINIIKYVLVAFAAVSLVVSSIMIGIITYVSVIERTKEIGVLRSLGARKKDISRVFNAETIIIGFSAGIMGIISAYILCIPINAIIKHFAGSVLTTSIAALNPFSAAMLVGVSMVLTLISGLVPSRIASRRDPVVALRSE